MNGDFGYWVNIFFCEWGNMIFIIGESAFPFLVNGEATPPPDTPSKKLQQ